jgi:hypothetical protein
MELLVMAREFYSLFGEETDVFGVACFAAKRRQYRLTPDAPVIAWSPPVVELRSGRFTDYLGCDLNVHLCSEKMHQVLDGFKSSIRDSQWLSLTVVRSNGQRRPYYILHLYSAPDVLDKTKTVFLPDGGRLVRPCLAPESLQGLSVFRLPNAPEHLIVSEEVRLALEEADCTGLQFTRVKQSTDAFFHPGGK